MNQIRECACTRLRLANPAAAMTNPPEATYARSRRATSTLVSGAASIVPAMGTSDHSAARSGLNPSTDWRYCVGRGLWAAQLEAMTLLDRHEELRKFLAGVQREAGAGLAELFLGIDPEADPETARMAGSVLHALFIGIMVKWFMDPGQALSAAEVAQGLQIIGARLRGGAAGDE